MTVLKTADDKQPQLDTLEALATRPDLDEPTRKRIREEIWTTRSGIQGERQAAYEIDFHYAKRDGYAVIHDLRVEFNGRVAQIDHLLINRVLDVWVCETKAFSQGVKIDEFGEWYRYGGRFAHGMASPVEQNHRHIEVLRDLFAGGQIRLPRRLGISLKPTFHSVVLISNDARIDRPKSKKARAGVVGLDTVIKVEQLVRTIEHSFDDRNPVAVVARLVGNETVRDVATQLISLHRPQIVDWAARFGIPPIEPVPVTAAVQQAPPVVAPERPVCESCARPLSERTLAYLAAQRDIFGGRLLCFDHQRAFRRSTKSSST